MATPKSTFAIELQDEVSGTADAAASALVNLQKKIDGGNAELKAMQAAMRNLKGASTPNVQAMKALQDRITATKQSVAQAQGKVLELGGGLGTLKRAGAGSSAGLKELLSTAQGMPGPLGGLASKLGAIRGLVAGGGAIAAGVLAIAAALVALVAAAGAATVALLRYGIAQADARRSELLRLEGLTTIRRHYYLAAGNATAMQAAIDRVSASVALGRGELVGYTQQLYRMGLRGQALEDALQGMATVASVQGEEQARRFAGMAAGAARAGGSVRRLADLVERRLGGIAARQLLSLDVQAAKLRESFAAIFLGLRIEGFLEGLRTLTQLFSQNTATGRALKTIAEALLQPLIDDLTRLAPFARRFFQGMVIGALQLTILILRLRNWFRDTFGATTIGGIDGMTLALYAGVGVIAALVGVATLAGVTLAALAASAALLVAPLALATAAVVGIVAAGIELYNWFRNTDFESLGRSLVDGLIAGMRSRLAALSTEVRGLASRAQGALTEALGIRSPSRVFAQLGVQIPRGLAQGVQAGAPIALGAIDELAAVPDVHRSPAGSSSRSVVIEQLHIHAQSSDPEALAASFRDAVANVLEGLAIEEGAPA